MNNIALIQLNDKELKLSIYKTSNGRNRLIEERSQPFKLGDEITTEELLRPKTKNELVEVLKIYRKMIETYKATKIIAVASNILTRARNYHGFIEEIYNNTGISFSILSDDEVVKYVYSSTVNNIDNSKGYIINIDSYKTNLIKYNRRTIIGSKTFDFGVVNLLMDDERVRSIDEMVEIVKKEISSADIMATLEDDASFVGTGAPFIAFGHIAKKIARYPLDIDNNYVVSKEIMEQTVNFIK